MNSDISWVAEQLKNSHLPLLTLAVAKKQQNDWSYLLIPQTY